MTRDSDRYPVGAETSGSVAEGDRARASSEASPMTNPTNHPDPHVVEAVALLPCPFCGGEAKAFYNGLEGLWSVRCTACDAAMDYIGLIEAEAIAAWNTRAIPTVALEREALKEIAYLRPAGDCKNKLVIQMETI